MSFTAKQQAFIREYPLDFNATQAALRAGYSERTAYSIGHENLNKPEIAAEIQKEIERQLMPLDEALAREATLARFDIGPYVKGTGDETSLDVEKMKRDGFGHLIRGIKKGRYGTTIETADPDAARRQIIKVYMELRKATGKEDDPIHTEGRIRFVDYGLEGDDATD